MEFAPAPPLPPAKPADDAMPGNIRDQMEDALKKD